MLCVDVGEIQKNHSFMRAYPDKDLSSLYNNFFFVRFGISNILISFFKCINCCAIS